MFFRSIANSLSLLSGRQRVAVFLLAVATLAINALDILAIASLGAVTALAIGDESSFAFLIPPSLNPDDALLLVLLAAAGLFSLKTILSVLVARTKENFLARLQISFSKVIGAYLFTGGLAKIKSYSKSDLEWAILRSTTLAFGKTISEALAFFAEISLFLAILFLFLIVDWRSGLLVTLFFAIILLLFQLTSRATIGAAGSKFAAGSVSVNQGVSDLVDAFREITVNAKTPFFLDRIILSRALAAKAEAKIAYLSALPRLLVELGLIVGALGFVVFQLLTSSGGLNLEVLSIFIIGSVRMMSALLPIQRAFMRVQYQAPQAEAAQKLVHEALNANLTPTVRPRRENPGGRRSSTSGLQLDVENVYYSYPDGLPTTQVLRDVTIQIPAGSTAALIGPSGAGKSTLADLILGLDRPSGGKVLCDGADPQVLRATQSGIMGYVPQKPGLITGTVSENIALGCLKEEIDEEALWGALRVAGLDVLMRSLPDGVDSKVGEQLDGFSGGQIQRIGLARALYSRPKLLVLDEATSALDPETEAAVSRGLATLRGHTTIITIAHRLATIQNADIIFLLESGKVVASGSLKDLMKTSPLVAKYVGLASIDAQSSSEFG